MSQYLPKLARYVPLWQRNVPHYPVYWKGNPQLRVYLPLFWMKLVRSERNTPPDIATFEVHHQMTRYDVKNYLEKIYDVKVLTVKCHLLRGKPRKDPLHGYDIQPENDKRIAWVQLEGSTFKFPDLFKEKETEDMKSVADYKKVAYEHEKDLQQNWSKADMPPWFR